MLTRHTCWHKGFRVVWLKEQLKGSAVRKQKVLLTESSYTSHLLHHHTNTSPFYSLSLRIYTLLSVVLQRVINLNISFRIWGFMAKEKTFIQYFVSIILFLWWHTSFRKVTQLYEWKWDENNLHFERVGFWGLWVLKFYIFFVGVDGTNQKNNKILSLSRLFFSLWLFWNWLERRHGVWFDFMFWRESDCDWT